jgi:two-component system, NarL family, response regulator
VDRITICLDAAHPVAAAQYRRLLSTGGEIRVVSRGRKALIAIFDGDPPAIEGALTSALRRSPHLRPLVLALRGDDTECKRWMRAGAWGLVTYDRYQREMPRAIHELAEGRLWFPGPVVLQWLHEDADRRQSTLHLALTPREREVIGFLRDGSLSNKEIASSLRITERTVKFHVGNILTKMQVGSRRELSAHSAAAAPSA